MAAGEAGVEVDEEFIRRKIEELLRRALFPRGCYRGLKATHEEVARELAEIRGNYARYGEAYVELVDKAKVGEEKAYREAEKAMREALKHVDELEIKRTGKARWKAKLPGRSWRLYIRRTPAGYWQVEVALYIKVAKLRIPDTLRLPPELLRAAQEGWILGDASYIADSKEVTMGTARVWQAVSFPGFWPGKEVVIYIEGIAINETRVSIMWFIRIRGVRDAPREWALRKEEKRGIILAEIERANNGDLDERRAVRIATYYAADGKYPGPNTAKRFLEFKVGSEPRRVRTEQSVKLAKILLEKAPQLLAFLCSAGCRKAKFLARLALTQPRPYHFSPWYLEVCGVKLNLQLVGDNNYRYLMAQVLVADEEALRDFPERARAEGLEVRRVVAARVNGKAYFAYRAGQKALMRYADRRPAVYDVLIGFVQEELQAMPPDHPARPSVEKLLERLKKAKKEALRKLGHQDAKA